VLVQLLDVVCRSLTHCSLRALLNGGKDPAFAGLKWGGVVVPTLALGVDMRVSASSIASLPVSKLIRSRRSSGPSSRWRRGCPLCCFLRSPLSLIHCFTFGCTGDKEPAFIGSKQWVGAVELSFVLDQLLGVSSRIITVSKGSELPTKAREIAHHLDTQGARKSRLNTEPQKP